VAPKLSNEIEPCPELVVESRPTYGHIARERVKSVSEPDINVDNHRSGANRAQSGLADRNWVVAQRTVKLLIQEHTIVPESGLVGL
jgi:hypothetical protein